MLRINDVGLRPMMLRFAQTEFSRTFRVFIGKKHSSFTVAPFPRPFELEVATLSHIWEFASFLIVPQGTTSFAWHTQHHLTEGQHHFEQRENIISHFFGTNERGCTNVQMMWCFASMMWAYAQWCCASRKRNFQELFVFLGVPPFFHNCTFFPTFWTWTWDFIAHLRIRFFFDGAAGTTSFDRRSTSFRATREHHFSFLRHKWTRLH